MSFEELGLRPEIVKALREEEIFEPTSIQSQAIPLVIKGRDVVGMSKTGSGKTVAFSVPLLERMKPGNGPQVLVLCPTRELAVQIAAEFEKFGKYMKVKVAAVYGGVALDPQIHAMGKADVIVGTPGRVLDHLERATINTEGIDMVVLDEADRMVDMGFFDDVTRIIDATKQGRQLLLFGATISDEIHTIKERYMTEPATVKAEANVEEEFLKQYFYSVLPQEKFSLLVHLLKKEATNRVMVFCSTRNMVDVLARNLKRQGVDAASIHGKLTQARRLDIMKQFNEGHPEVLVASAVAARGLHIEEVSHVFNWDLSQDPEEYIHRVGRTARAGEKGKAITLLSSRDHDVFNDVIHRFGMNVKELPLDNFQKLRFDMGRRDSEGPRGSYQCRSSGFRGGPRGAPRSGPRGESGSRDGFRSSGRPSVEPERARPVRWGGR
ncbi:MAG: DEAD/DEAH box helicase [Candidatus Woesearchaeota archaeon]